MSDYLSMPAADIQKILPHAPLGDLLAIAERFQYTTRIAAAATRAMIAESKLRTLLISANHTVARQEHVAEIRASALARRAAR